MTRLISVGRHSHALVDDEDYGVLSQRKWHLNKRYAVTGRRKIKMEWMILPRPEGKVIDHKNGNGLDNRRENLRICTRKQNGANQGVANISGRSSRFRGVYLCGGRWRVQIKTGGKRESLGCYGTQEEAALAYNLAAKARFGEFARLNDVLACRERKKGGK